MSADIPAAGRGVANVILDGVVAFDPEAGTDANVTATDLAVSRLAEVDDAYSVTLSDDDEVSLDLSNVVGGAMVAMSRLVHLHAEATGSSPESVVADLRAWLG